MQKKITDLNNVEKLLKSEFVTQPTRIVLENRLNEDGIPHFFNQQEFELLSIICDLLVDQNSEDRVVPIALAIDERLTNNQSDGWRYDLMPPDRVMYKLGLKGIDQMGRNEFNKSFLSLEEDCQIDLLTKIQNGDVKGEIWQELNSKLFFEELLAESVEIFYSHPLIQANINYVGMADAKGWQKIGLGQSELPE